jgi:hypothetical protein
VREGRVVLVIVSDDDAPLGNGDPEHALTDLQLQPADPAATAIVWEARIVGKAEAPLVRFEQIDHRPIRLEQPRRLFDGTLEDAGDVGRGGSRRRG